MSERMDGNALAERILSSLSKAEGLKLAIVDTSGKDASFVYIRSKMKSAERLGITAKLFRPETQKETISLIEELNQDATFTGIIVQMPLGSGFDTKSVLESLAPEKDIDCLGPVALGKVMLGDESIPPPTAAAITSLLEEYHVPLEGRKVVIVNNSNILGKPLSMMLTNRFATVTLCHVKTRNLASHTREADILVTAAGVPGMIKADMVKSGAVVIDAGIAVLSGKVTGDVDFERVSEKASLISPVPGGVGPVTVAMLMSNIVRIGRKLV